MQLSLSTKPDAEHALQRVEAWFAAQMLDRSPVRFSAHNVDFICKGPMRHLSKIARGGNEHDQ